MLYLPRTRMENRSLPTAAYVAGFVALLALAGFAGAPLARTARPKATPSVVAAVSSSSPATIPPTASTVPAPSASAVTSISAVPSAAPPPRIPVGPGARVLVLGDSMADAGFSQRLAEKVKARGGTLESDAWTSASTTTWSRGDRLDKLIARVKPTAIFVVLGANEVFIPNPDVLAPNVRAIVGKVSAQPCVWVTPPLWKGETGIVAVEKAHAAPCRFFDSSNLAIARRKDGIHPTDKGGADWADAVWSALVGEDP